MLGTEIQAYDVKFPIRFNYALFIYVTFETLLNGVMKL